MHDLATIKKLNRDAVRSYNQKNRELRHKLHHELNVLVAHGLINKDNATEALTNMLIEAAIQNN